MKKTYHWMIFLGMSLWFIPLTAHAQTLNKAMPTLSLYTPSLGQARTIQRSYNNLWMKRSQVTQKVGEGQALTSHATDDAGSGSPIQAFQAIFWGVGIPLLVLDTVVIVGMVYSLFAKKNRYAWGVLGTVGGSLTILWGFFSFAEGLKDTILVGIPMWTVGFATLIMGILSLSIGKISEKNAMLPTIRTKNMKAVFSPWMSADQEGKPIGGLAVTGTFF